MSTGDRPGDPLAIAGRNGDRGLRVLIVEDVATDAELMARYLRRSGVEPELLVVQDEGPFREALEGFQPDVVLVDNSLPRFSGRQALRLARRHDPILPVVMVTGTLDEHRLLRLMRVGLTNYVLKDRLQSLGIAVVHAVEQARERRQAQRDRAALEASERRFRAVAEGSANALFVSDARGVILYVNESVRRILGYHPDRLVGRHGSLLTGSGQEREMETFLGDHGVPLASLEGRFLEVELRHAEGHPVPVELSFSTWTEQGHRYFATHLRDLTQRRAAERERMLLAMAIEQSANAILITDTEGTLQYVNAAFEEMTGYTREEAIGENPRILKSGAQSEAFYRDMWARLTAGESFQTEFVNRRKDGAEYRQRSLIFPIRDERGATRSYVGIAQDVTRERQLEEQFRQAQKMEALGQFAAGIAHDFNNVLTGILGTADLLAESVTRPSNRQHLDDIVKGARQGADLVRSLMSLSRFQPTEQSVVGVDDSVDDVVRTIRRMMPSNIEVSVEHEAPAAKLRCTLDEGAFHQALMNLATNARDAMPEGGRLQIRTGVDGDRVRVQVVDTGSGMPEELIRHIFDPFFTTKERGKGTGLGMVMVKQFAEGQGGEIAIESTPGRGTTMSLFLPRMADSEVAPAEAGEEGASPPEVDRPVRKRAGKMPAHKVLLAEDQPQVALVARRVLERMGLRVLVARDGAEALDLLQRHRGEVRLVVSDLVMPRMGGVELYNTVSAWPDAPRFLMTSGYAPQEMKGAHELLRDVPFLPKPWRLAAFRERVTELLAEAED